MKKFLLMIALVGQIVAKPVKWELKFVSSDEIVKNSIKPSDLYLSEIKDARDIFRLRSVIVNDVIFCRKRLKGLGRFDGKVSYDISEDKKAYHVVITVDFGSKYLVRSLSITDHLGRPIHLPEADVVGKPIQLDDLIGIEERLIDKYGKLGYPFARVLRKKITVLHELKKVDIDLVASLGKQSKFGAIRIVGNSGVNESFILKQVPWERGDKFDSKKLEEFRQNLMEFNLFNQVILKVFEDENGDAGVKVSLSEAKTRLFEVGAKYSSSNSVFYSKKLTRKITGIMTTLGWTNFNVFGNGEILGLYLEGTPFYSKNRIKTSSARSVTELQVAQKEGVDIEELKKKVEYDSKKISPDSRIRVRFERPKYDGKRTFTFVGTLSNSWDVKYVKRAKEVEGSISQLLTPHLFHSFGLSGERYKLSEFETLVEGISINKVKRYTFVNLGYKVVYNWFDDKRDPQSGGKLEGYVSPKIGDLSKTTLLMTHIKYTQMLDVKIASATFWASYDCLMFGTYTKIPVDKLLYSGGQNSIRGYAKNYACKFNGDYPEGGRSCIEVGMEFLKRVSSTLGVVLFFEGSKVGLGKIPRKEKVFSGYGIGARYYTSFAPVNLEIAFPSRHRRGIDSFCQILISVGKSL